MGCLLYRQDNLTTLIKRLGGQKAKLLSLLQLIFRNRKSSVGDVQSQTITEWPLLILTFSNHIQWSCMENENLGLAFSNPLYEILILLINSPEVLCPLKK